MPVPIDTPIRHYVGAKVHYSIDWLPQLAPGETILAGPGGSSWTVVSGTVTIGNDGDDATPGVGPKAGAHSASMTTIWVHTASVGAIRIKNTIVTSLGQHDPRYLLLDVVA